MTTALMLLHLHRTGRSYCGGQGEGDDTAQFVWLDVPRDWRVAVERHVRAILVVVRRTGPNQSQQMLLPQDDHVVEKLTPESADKTLSIPSRLLKKPGRGIDSGSQVGSAPGQRLTPVCMGFTIGTCVSLFGLFPSLSFS
jgi:hypothetical protein